MIDTKMPHLPEISLESGDERTQTRRNWINDLY
jgi:hypothetical protein